MSNRDDSQVPDVKLPLWLTILGAVIFAGSAVLAARLIWEQTVWTWERGPQMVGFSLAHGSGALLFLFPILLIVWSIVVVTVTIWSLIRRKRVAIATWVLLGVAALLFSLMGLPEGLWERAFIQQMAASPRAGDLLVYAAYRGDVGTVRAFISHGVPINATDHSDWRTGLHAAAVGGDLRTTEYLVSKGADVNVLDRSGDSPLELASERGHRQVASFLEAHGAKTIRGDEAQHQKAIHDKVQEDIEELDRAEAADKKLQDDIKRAESEKQNKSNKPH
jgi:hypothetical protein